MRGRPGTCPRTRSAPKPERGIWRKDEWAAPASHESQLAYGSPVFAAGAIPVSHRASPSRITRTQQAKPTLQTPFDLRCVHRPGTYGLHADETPSLQLYEDGTFYCYGCGAGGSIYDFAGTLWSLGTKGHAFLKLRAQLAHSFGLRAGAGF
jgi:hypothetical protein